MFASERGQLSQGNTYQMLAIAGTMILTPTNDVILFIKKSWVGTNIWLIWLWGLFCATLQTYGRVSNTTKILASEIC